MERNHEKDKRQSVNIKRENKPLRMKTCGFLVNKSLVNRNITGRNMTLTYIDKHHQQLQQNAHLQHVNVDGKLYSVNMEGFLY